MSITTNPNDPRLQYGLDIEPRPQNEVYLVLSEEERAKGFIRPVRRSYKHVGKQPPKNELRDLTQEEKERFSGYGYIKFEVYPEEMHPKIGRFWTQEQLDTVNKGCRTVTTMAQAIAETYARQPEYYGSTYCTGCQKHLPVDEFVWIDDETVVGS